MNAEAHEAGKKLALELMNNINSINYNSFCDGFIYQIIHSHRTLVQMFMGQIIAQFIIQEAEDKNYDDRNKKTVEVCKKLRDCLEASDNNYSNYPMI